MAAKSKSPLNRPLKFIIPLLVVVVLGVGFVLTRSGMLPESGVTNILEPKLEVLPAKIKSLQAKVNITSESKTEALEVGTERELKDGDQINTDLNGIAEITYQSGTTVRIGQESEITFSNSSAINQVTGKIYVRFKSLLGIQENFEVESQTAVAAVRGTAFASIVKVNVDARILVSDHEVEVTPKDKDGKRLEDQKKTVGAGEQAVVARLNRVLTTAPQKLTTEEKEWLEFNTSTDEGEDSARLITDTSTLKKRTPTPVPTPRPSVAPTATPVPLTQIGSMPGLGYTKSNVVTPNGTFPLACYGASRGSTRMLTDSASDSDCTNNCPVLSLGDYAARNGAVAAMNGMYFCPADYASCAGKVNSFDTLFFNSRTRNYMNSANNVYSNIPFVGMNADHSMSFVGASSSWGRDTGIIGGTAGNPILTNGGGYVVNEGGLDDKQRNVKSNRGAIVQEGDAIYLCVTQGATVPDSGRVFATLGADNAINVDGGGSSALWVQGSYKYGPGRSIPTAIIFAP